MSAQSEREATAARLSAFAAAMAAARTAADMSQLALGEAIGRQQGSVSRYEAGLLEPDPFTVFEMERALGLKPGALSHYLGYMPINFDRLQRILPVLDALENDPRLDAQAKTMLISVYRNVARVTDRLRSPSRRGEDEEDEPAPAGWYEMVG